MNKISSFIALLLAMQFVACRTSEIITMTQNGNVLDTVQNAILTITNVDSGNVLHSGTFDIEKTYIYFAEINGDTMPIILWRINLPNDPNRYLLAMGLSYNEIDTTASSSDIKWLRPHAISNITYNNVICKPLDIAHSFGGGRYTRAITSAEYNTFSYIGATNDEYQATSNFLFYKFRDWGVAGLIYGEGSSDDGRVVAPTNIIPQTVVYRKYIIIGESLLNMGNNGISDTYRIQYSLNVWLPTNLQKPQ